MARFSETLTLRRKVPVQDAAGAVVPENEDSEVFFNRYRVSLANRSAAASEGMFGLVVGQVRSIDYDGQQSAVYAGDEYTVDDASDSGEFTVLTLSRRLSDG